MARRRKKQLPETPVAATIESLSHDGRGIARLDGKPGVALEIQRQSGADLVVLARHVRAELERIRSSLPPGVQIRLARDYPVYIENLVRSVFRDMLLAAGELRVALATTHLPLAQVPSAVTRESLTTTLQILAGELTNKWGIKVPRITVLGLNPHAGEGGHLGSEEIDIIAPTLEALRARGLELLGPLPADTAFNDETRAVTDAYLAMYHDQGLPVLKYAGFGEAVNVTLGLPILRTSVDHGTALTLAGTGKAKSGSLEAAIDLTVRMLEQRSRARPA